MAALTASTCTTVNAASASRRSQPRTAGRTAGGARGGALPPLQANFAPDREPFPKVAG